MHWLTSGSEAAAMKVLSDAYSKAGGQWVDNAVPDYDSAIAAGTTAILNGNPPAALMFNAGTQFQDLAQQGYLADLSGYASEQKWADALPSSLREAITYEGKIFGLPIDVQSESWVFTSKAAFAKAGVEMPTKWDDFFPMLDKLKAAGFVPIAHGGESWQELELFYTVMMFRGNRDLYEGIFIKGDEAVLTTPEFKEFSEDFKKLTNYIDPGAPGRKWNDAAAMVIQGKAGMQFMGDWAKSEFVAAGQKPGVDFDCFLGLGGNENYVMISDVFVLPGGKGLEAAQKLLSSTIMSPAVQVEFNKVKGGLPARIDAENAATDVCSAKGQAATRAAGVLVAGPEISMSADRYGSIMDAISQYWNTPDMTADMFIETMRQAIRSTAG
ncbi:ABC transporter substrate-binding protein [Rhizobium sp. CF142]|uniref:ABC transporter substrate-binding protein n=1 Tax=Rhizobium sp. CF142 TaxID=1144314 RepID=UPI0012F6E1FE|nr:ABC transporter substrate-binding protein [Rhizobium sp. CF142]